jgi:VWFA-related protein
MGDCRVIVVVMLATCGLCADALFARQAASAPEVASQHPSPSAEIRVQSVLVNEPVTVRDAKGAMVHDLQVSDFQVTDNGVPQTITQFDVGGDALSLVIVVETSSRVEALMPKFRKTGVLVTQTVMGPNAEAGVVGFNDEVKTLQPFTANPDKIEEVFSHLDNGTSGSKLYDALALGVEMLSERPEGTATEPGRRRIMLVLAEADDKGSEAKLDEVVRKAQLENITIWSVSLSTVHALIENRAKMKPSDPGYGDNNLIPVAKWAVTHMRDQVAGTPLEIAALATGGSSISIWKDRLIGKAIDRIGGELHSQYLLTYTPTGTGAGGFHEIQVKVDEPKTKVKFRPGYYLDGASSSH